jgi:2-oxoglutarate dehydrogenase complex dehydrogenase (E1) component-like enzyme
MIGEIALLIKGLDTACQLVRAGLDRKKDLDSMSSEIFSFFESKKEVEKKIAEVKKNKGGYEGSALQEAILIEQESHKINVMMAQIGKAYSVAGRTPQWMAIQRNAANIQKDRDSSYAQAHRRKVIQDRKDADFYLALKLIAGLVLLMVGIAGLVFALALN